MRKEILLEQADELRKLKLPPKWEVSKLDVTFRRSGFMEDYAEVIYDSTNKTFYVKTNKSIVYPDEVQTMKQAIGVMNKANAIINEVKVIRIIKDEEH